MELKKIFLTTETTIYIGYHGNHFCPNNHIKMEEFLAVLSDRQGQELVLKMKQCPMCGKVYLRGDKYQKFWYRLKNYSFIRTKTGKPPSESYIATAHPFQQKTEPLDWDEIYPTPAYLIQALRHPYQGGRCSGK